MNHVSMLYVTLMVCFLSACDETVSLSYDTYREADSEVVFARGWLPEVIPTSSYEISMCNDLDLNSSKGDFKFSTEDLAAFLNELERASELDTYGSRAFRYGKWIFWIGDDGGQCNYSMRNSNKARFSEQNSPAKPNHDRAGR